MSSPQGKRDIVRLRTFRADVDHAQEEQGLDEKTVNDAIGAEDAAAAGGVLHKIKKKSLDLKDNSETAKSLDAEGISFDEETAQQVADRAYEENKSLKEAPTPEEQVVDGHSGEMITPASIPVASAEESATKSKPATSAIPKAPEPAIETGASNDKSADAFLAMTAKDTPAAPASKPTAPEIPPTPVAAPEQPAVKEPGAASTEIKLNEAETTDQIKPVHGATIPGNGEVHEVTDDDLADGSIVNDKKRERFKLFPAMGQAMSDWFVDTKDQIEEAQREKHLVAKTEERADTIKAAAQAKTFAPDEDFSQVAERLKHTEKQPMADARVMVKPKAAPEPGSWTYTTDEAAPAAPAPEPVTLPASEPIAPPPPPQPEPVPTPVATPEPVATELDSGVTLIENAKITPEDLADLVTPDAAPGQATRGPVAPPDSAAQTAPRRSRSTATVLSRGSGSAREFLPSPVLALGVVLIAIIAGVGTSLYFFWQPSQETTVPVASAQPLFTAELQADVNFDGSHGEIMQTLLAGAQSNSGTLHLSLTRNAGQEIVSPTDVMRFLAPLAPGSFTRSVTNVSFGSQDSQPFIVLQVNNFDSAFAGMLAWEQTMSADLSPLFGPVVTESYDPLSRTDSRTRAAFFKDVIASNLSGRLLANERAEDRILYTFIDKQTVVITTDRLQLTNILPLIR